jgi:pimeloyl-ACP methyl ester carboxylesterase
MTYAGWKHMPSTYVRADGDRGYLSPTVVDAMLQKAREAVPTSFDVEERTDAGHLFMLSRPEWFADVLRRAAGEKV